MRAKDTSALPLLFLFVVIELPPKTQETRAAWLENSGVCVVCVCVCVREREREWHEVDLGTARSVHQCQNEAMIIFAVVVHKLWRLVRVVPLSSWRKLTTWLNSGVPNICVARPGCSLGKFWYQTVAISPNVCSHRPRCQEQRKDQWTVGW